MEQDTALRKIIQARTALILNEPFFGTLALRLQAHENAAILTFRTNGVDLEYNPAYADKLTNEECQGVVCHEVLHCANNHTVRRDKRDPKLWNAACDYAINPIVVDAGFRLPGQPLLELRFRGMSAEQIYSILEQEQQQQQQSKDSSNSNGNDSSDGNSDSSASQPGEVADAPTGKESTLEAEWKVATLQAAQIAQAQGKLPGSLKGLIQQLKETRIDWRSATMRFAQERCACDYSWVQPNRRYIQQGLYLPSLYDTQMGEMVLVIDTSGSVQSIIPAFGAHMQNILDTVRPRLLHVVYCDADIQHVEMYTPDDTIVLRTDGGGGTDFRPPFAWVAAQGIEPACLIYLTDLYGEFPAQAPDYPVLWASTTAGHAPFGETLHIDED